MSTPPTPISPIADERIRSIDATVPEDFEKLWRMWHIVFSSWPITRERLLAIFTLLPGAHHLMSEHGFVLAYLEGGKHGKIAAVGVMPAYQGKGLGTKLLDRARDELEKAAWETEGEGKGKEKAGLKSLEIGSGTPRFWNMVPTSFPEELKAWFTRRGESLSPWDNGVVLMDTGFKKGDKVTRDLYRDIRGEIEIASPEVMEKVSQSHIEFRPWSPELEEECLTKQRALFVSVTYIIRLAGQIANGQQSWYEGYEALAQYKQHDEVLVAIDPETGAQIGWTFCCGPTAVINGMYAFMPLMPSGDKTGLIAAVGIDPSTRGKGVGLAMMVKAVERLKERGVEGIQIDGTVLRGFYERIGFDTMWEFEQYAYDLGK